MSRKKLGKNMMAIGLTELLSSFNATATPTTITDAPSLASPSQQLPIEQLQPSQLQPRQHFDEAALAELAASIKSQGIIQPIIVRPLTTDCFEIIAGERRWRAANCFEIIAGERRWRAAQLANLTHVPVLIRQLNDQDAIVVALIENIQRRDLNVLEEAQALQRLLEEFHLTHQVIALAVGKSRTAITNLLRLLNLTPSIKASLASNQLNMGHARALLALPEAEQDAAAQHIIAKQLSVRDTEDYIRQLLTPHSHNQPATQGLMSDPKVVALQQRLAEKLATKVSIKHNRQGKGKLVIHYSDLAMLDSIIEHIEL